MDSVLADIAKTTGEPGVIAASVYLDGRRLRDIAIDEAGAWSRKEGQVVWIGLKEPSAGLLLRVQAQLDLHPLAIEGAAKAHQYPKLERYGDPFFIVARISVSRRDAARGMQPNRRSTVRGLHTSVSRRGSSRPRLRRTDRRAIDCQVHAEAPCDGGSHLLLVQHFTFDLARLEDIFGEGVKNGLLADLEGQRLHLPDETSLSMADVFQQTGYRSCVHRKVGQAAS